MPQRQEQPAGPLQQTHAETITDSSLPGISQQNFQPSNFPSPLPLPLPAIRAAITSPQSPQISSTTPSPSQSSPSTITLSIQQPTSSITTTSARQEVNANKNTQKTIASNVAQSENVDKLHQLEGFNFSNFSRTSTHYETQQSTESESIQSSIFTSYKGFIAPNSPAQWRNSSSTHASKDNIMRALNSTIETAQSSTSKLDRFNTTESSQTQHINISDSRLHKNALDGLYSSTGSVHGSSNLHHYLSPPPAHLYASSPPNANEAKDDESNAHSLVIEQRVSQRISSINQSSPFSQHFTDNTVLTHRNNSLTNAQLSDNNASFTTNITSYEWNSELERTHDITAYNHSDLSFSGASSIDNRIEQTPMSSLDRSLNTPIEANSNYDMTMNYYAPSETIFSHSSSSSSSVKSALVTQQESNASDASNSYFYSHSRPVDHGSSYQKISVEIQTPENVHKGYSQYSSANGTMKSRVNSLTNSTQATSAMQFLSTEEPHMRGDSLNSSASSNVESISAKVKSSGIVGPLWEPVMRNSVDVQTSDSHRITLTNSEGDSINLRSELAKFDPTNVSRGAHQKIIHHDSFSNLSPSAPDVVEDSYVTSTRRPAFITWDHDPFIKITTRTPARTSTRRTDAILPAPVSKLFVFSGSSDSASASHRSMGMSIDESASIAASRGSFVKWKHTNEYMKSQNVSDSKNSFDIDFTSSHPAAGIMTSSTDVTTTTATTTTTTERSTVSVPLITPTISQNTSSESTYESMNDERSTSTTDSVNSSTSLISEGLKTTCLSEGNTNEDHFQHFFLYCHIIHLGDPSQIMQCYENRTHSSSQYFISLCEY